MENIIQKVLRCNGERKGSIWYYYDGHTYHRDVRCFADDMIIRCSNRGETGCTATLRINDELEILEYTSVTHVKCGEPRHYIPKLEELKSTLVKKSKESFKDLKAIYNKCIEDNEEYVHCK